ncbi:MAG: T9SS type A sorting domain-containing protein [Bacteroidota bacterium]
MKTIYNKLKLLDLLKPLALMVLFLVLGYNAQSQSSNSPVCKGEPIRLFCTGYIITECDGHAFIQYSWSNEFSSWTESVKNPVIEAKLPSGADNPFYKAGTYYLSVKYKDNIGDPWQTQNGETTVVFTLDLIPGDAAADQEVCPATRPVSPLTCTAFTAGSGPAFTYYYWQKREAPAITFTDTPVEGYGTPPFDAVPVYDFSLFPVITANTEFRVKGVNMTCNDPSISAVYSNIVTISVRDVPGAGTIELPQTICTGATPDPLIGSDEGVGTTYKWEVSSVSIPAWTVIVGQTGKDLTLGALTENTSYRRWTLAGTCISPTATDPLEITVQTVPTAGSIAANQTICDSGTPADLTNVTAGTGDDPTPTYNWESSVDGGLTWLPAVPENHGEGFDFGATELTETTMFHRITVSTVGTTECFSGATLPVTIIVQEVIAAGTIAESQTICNGVTPAPLTGSQVLPGPDAFIIYHWEESSVSVPVWTNIAGGINKDLTLPALTETTSYRRWTVSILGEDTCWSALPAGPVTIVVQDVVTAGTIAANQTICAGYAPDEIGGNNATGSGTLTYEWYVSIDGVNWDIIPGATDPFYTPDILTVTTYYKRMTKSSEGAIDCYSGFSNIVTITVDAIPVIHIEGPQDLCQGSCGFYTVFGQSPTDIIEWSISGTYATLREFGSSIEVCWGECTSGLVTVTISRGNCTVNASLPVTLHAAPNTLVHGPITVSNGDTVTYFALPGDPTHLFNWLVSNGTIVGGQGSPAVQVVWDAPCMGCTGEVCVYETVPEFPGCNHDQACMNVYILPEGANVFGYVAYENAYNTGVNNVRLTLWNADDLSVVGYCTSGPNLLDNGKSGYFAFVNVPYGDYVLTADNMVYEGVGGPSYPGEFPIWGGNNATDALIVQMSVPGPLSTDVKTLAADVNGSMTISALDALFIKLRVVELIDGFPAGDWAFAHVTFSLDEFIHPVQEFVGPDAFFGLCYGDVNGSFVPQGFKSASTMNTIEDGLVSNPAGESFTYDIRSNASAELGAMTLKLNFDQNLFEIEKVTTSLEGLQYKVNNGKLSIAWSDVNGLAVGANEPIISVSVKAKSEISNPTQIFTLGDNCEFANTKAETLNFDLKMANVVTGAKTFSLVNYPNPFKNTTTIAYTLPEAGQVRLVITDMFGKTVSVLVDAMEEAGNHTVVVNPDNVNLSQGVYLYKIDVTGTTDTYSKVNKLIFQK